MMKCSMIFKKLQTSMWPQWLAGVEVGLLSLMMGMNVGWTSPFIGSLSSQNPPFNVPKEQMVWVASLVHLTRTGGVIVSSVMSTLRGSRQTVYICGFYFLISWICLICANDIDLVFISLVCNGMSQSTISTIAPLYIAEISAPEIRGKLITFIIQGLTMGTLFGNIIGAYLSPWVYAAINLIPCILFLITFRFFPHTPHYLVRCENEKEAAKSLQFYTRNADVATELKNLTEFLNSKPPLSFFDTLFKLNTPVNRRVLVMMNVIYSLGQLNGLSTISSYMEVLFTEAHVTITSPSVLVIIIGMISVVCAFVTVYVIGKFKRTTIVFVSCIVYAVGLFAWGLNYHLLDLKLSLNLEWLTCIGAIAYRMSIILGMVPVISTIMSEIFAPDVKDMAVCICNITNGLCSFLSNRYFQLMIDCLTLKYVFYLFGVISLLLAIYTKIFVPETKGKSLREIQVMLNNEVQDNSHSLPEA